MRYLIVHRRHSSGERPVVQPARMRPALTLRLEDYLRPAPRPAPPDEDEPPTARRPDLALKLAARMTDYPERRP